MTTGRKIWKPGPALDQDWDACVAFAWAGLFMAAPTGDVHATAEQGRALAFRINVAALNIANDGYNAAELGGEWAKRRGLIDDYAAATDVDDLAATVTTIGPVVFTCDWYLPSMGGTRGDGSIAVRPNDNPVMHCVFIHGYDPARVVRGVARPAFKFRNSWSRNWGQKGSAWITATDLDRLLVDAGGYATNTCYPLGRHKVAVAELIA